MHKGRAYPLEPKLRVFAGQYTYPGWFPKHVVFNCPVWDDPHNIHPVTTDIISGDPVYTYGDPFGYYPVVIATDNGPADMFCYIWWEFFPDHTHVRWLGFMYQGGAYQGLLVDPTDQPAAGVVSYTQKFPAIAHPTFPGSTVFAAGTLPKNW